MIAVVVAITSDLDWFLGFASDLRIPHLLGATNCLERSTYFSGRLVLHTIYFSFVKFRGRSISYSDPRRFHAQVPEPPRPGTSSLKPVCLNFALGSSPFAITLVCSFYGRPCACSCEAKESGLIHILIYLNDVLGYVIRDVCYMAYTLLHIVNTSSGCAQQL